jgi:hypothetical protein
MIDANLNSRGDMVLGGVLLVCMILAFVGGLDVRLANGKTSPVRERTPSGLDENGEPILSDPDGRAWRRR